MFICIPFKFSCVIIIIFTSSGIRAYLNDPHPAIFNKYIFKNRYLKTVPQFKYSYSNHLKVDKAKSNMVIKNPG